MAVVALEKSIRAGGGLGSSGVPMHLTAVPGDDGKAELANVSPRPTATACLWPHSLACVCQIWRTKAKMLYAMKRMREAHECCKQGFELLPGDQELEDLLWDIGERM